MQRRSLPLPTARLGLLLAGTSPLFLLSVPVGLLADAVLLALGLFDALRANREPKPEVSRVTPPRISTGSETVVEIRLRGIAPRTVRVQVTDDVPSGLDRLGPERAELSVVRSRTMRWRYQMRAENRGRFEMGPVHLRIQGPMGFASIPRVVPLHTPIQVQPGLEDLRRYRLLAMPHRRRDLGLRSLRLRGQAGVFESLREYIRGDDPRHIEWKSSARHRHMVVRQYQVEQSQNIMLAIDLGRIMTEEIGGGRSRLDHALSAALLLAYVAGIHQDRVGLFAFADDVQVFLPPSRLGIDRLADILTDVQGRMVEPHYPRAFSVLGRQLKRRSLIVLFTDVIDPGASKALLAHLVPAARRHLPLVVALRNPQVEAAANSPERDHRSLTERAAAEELLDQRARTLAAMRRSGVLVADTLPSDAAPDVLNAYLDVKRRALL